MLRRCFYCGLLWLLLVGSAGAQTDTPTPISRENAFFIQELARYQTAAISEVAWSHDGERLFVGHMNGLIEMLNPDNLEDEPVLITDHTPGVGITMLRVSPDDTLLASSSMDGSVQLWDMEARQTTGIFHHRGPVWAVDFHPDGDVLVTGDQNGLIQLWDMASGRAIRGFAAEHDLTITQVQYNAEGNLLYSTSVDRTARVWDAATGEQLAEFADHFQAVSTLALSHDEQWLVTGGGDSSVIVWDVANATRLDILNGHQGGVSALTFSLDDSLLLSAGQDSIIRFWDIEAGELVMALQEHNAWVQTLAFSPDGSRLVSGDMQGQLIVWGLVEN